MMHNARKNLGRGTFKRNLNLEWPPPRMNAIIRISRAEQGVCKLFSQFSASLSIGQ